MIRDLVIKILQKDGAACVHDPRTAVIKSTCCDSDGNWKRLLFIIEDDIIHVSCLGKAIAVCVSVPDFDLEKWLFDLRWQPNTIMGKIAFEFTSTAQTILDKMWE